jgi:hypothetical protein
MTGHKPVIQEAKFQRIEISNSLAVSLKFKTLKSGAAEAWFPRFILECQSWRSCPSFEI